MAGLLLLDTSILVVAERERLPVEVVAEPTPDARLAMSVITVAELLYGLRRAQTERQRQSRTKFIDDALARLLALPVDLPVARQLSEIWTDLAGRGEVIGPFDLVIAATALAYRAPLVTLNAREFRRVKGLAIHALRARPERRAP
jgi:tRNA(fMet)-specific endonuclease VapC